jgi:Leucine-rich repeat (LRR) protein
MITTTIDFSSLSDPKTNKCRSFNTHISKRYPTYANKPAERSPQRRTSLQSSDSFISSPPRRRNIIDGFVLLDASTADLPEQALEITVTPKGYDGVQLDDLEFFQHLEYLDVSENNLDLFDFSTLTTLRDLRIPFNHIRNLHLNASVVDLNKCFPCLQYLDLSYNSISTDTITQLRHLPLLTELGTVHYYIQCIQSIL